MNKKNSLIIGRAIFTLFIVIAFGLIIMNEKGAEIFTPKIKEKITQYLNENYTDIKDTIKIQDIAYNNKKFKAKVVSNNKKYFYVTYYKGKITDTYKEDYESGKSIQSQIEKNLEKEILNKTKEQVTIKLVKNIGDYSDKVQDKILNNDFYNLKVYYIEKELEIEKFNEVEISKEINSIITLLYNNKYTPKYYKITITDKSNVLNTIEISNIDETFIDNKDRVQIIKDIINDNNSTLIRENNITYKFLN